MSHIEEEIIRIIADSSNHLKMIEEIEKNNIIQNIRSTFISGDLRALRLGFKYIATSIPYNETYPYLKLRDVLVADEDLYLLIDDLNVTYHLLKGKIEDIISFIGDCEGLDEYYIISTDFKRLLCENDHDELLSIDIRQNHIRDSFQQ